MQTVALIPARYGSQRLPGKPLLRATGKYLIQHVYERACQTRGVDDVMVATDDTRIAAAVGSFGGKAVLTRRDHRSGTDRIAEVAARLDADVILNVQGDEPDIEPAALELLLSRLREEPDAALATLAAPIRDMDQWQNPNCVKVVCDGCGSAIYFSRSPIPAVREGPPNFDARPALFLQHLGVYAYRRPFLLELAALPVHPLEEAEKLEQLRVLAHGWRIKVLTIDRAAPGVDTYADYERFRRAFQSRRGCSAA